jgi:hypothetical protein
VTSVGFGLAAASLALHMGQVAPVVAALFLSFSALGSATLARHRLLRLSRPPRDSRLSKSESADQTTPRSATLLGPLTPFEWSPKPWLRASAEPRPRRTF